MTIHYTNENTLTQKGQTSILFLHKNNANKKSYAVHQTQHSLVICRVHSQDTRRSINFRVSPLNSRGFRNWTRVLLSQSRLKGKNRSTHIRTGTTDNLNLKKSFRHVVNPNRINFSIYINVYQCICIQCICILFCFIQLIPRIFYFLFFPRAHNPGRVYRVKGNG